LKRNIIERHWLSTVNTTCNRNWEQDFWYDCQQIINRFIKASTHGDMSRSMNIINCIDLAHMSRRKLICWNFSKVSTWLNCMEKINRSIWTIKTFVEGWSWLIPFFICQEFQAQTWLMHFKFLTQHSVKLLMTGLFISYWLVLATSLANLPNIINVSLFYYLSLKCLLVFA
jgi:hypothetical protein